jgi:hypothetical protein
MITQNHRKIEYTVVKQISEYTTLTECMECIVLTDREKGGQLNVLKYKKQI